MERIRYLCSEYNLSEFSKHYFVFCDLCHWLTINMKMFYYISEQCPYIKIMIDCVGGFCWPTHAAMQSIENHIWRSRFAISTKLKLYNTYILPIFLYSSDCGRYQRRTQIGSMHSTSGVCVCCLTSNGTNLYGMMMYGG